MKFKILIAVFVLIGLGFLVSGNIFARDGGPAAQDPDINIREPFRGWLQANFPGGLIDHPQNTDPLAPQLSTLIGDTVNNNPNFGDFFQVRARGGAGLDSSNEFTPGMAIIQAQDGQSIKVPDSGHPIGGGFAAVVLYATDSDIVIHYGLEDSAAFGYTIHILDINVEPTIKYLYDIAESDGRKQLVALPCGELLGTVKNGGPLVTIRDKGSFMDPRFKDWWTQPLQNCEDGGIPGLVTPTTPQAYDTNAEIPCDQNTLPPLTNPEYHSLRPYPANPCYKKIEDTTLLCANDLVVVKEPHETTLGNNCVRNINGSTTCTYTNVQMSSNVSISLDTAELPIMGNTEDVPNATWTSPNTNANNLTPAQRMNNYVSWYLNGVINRAEEDFLSFDPKILINYSGPLNKLLPWAGQALNRIASVEDANTTINRGKKDPVTGIDDKTARHNQIVGCQIPGQIGIGMMPCYLDVFERILSMVKLIYPNADLKPEDAALYLGEAPKRLAEWMNKKPPLEKDFPTFDEYWKKYLEWRGQTCTPKLFGTKFYFCFGIGGATTNIFAMLFNYIPSSTTEDRKGQIGTATSPDLTGSGSACRTIGAPCATACANGKTFGPDACPGNGSFDSCSQWAIEACRTVASVPSGSSNNPNESNIGLVTSPQDAGITEVRFEPDAITNDQHSLYFVHMQEDAELASKLQNTFKSTFATSESLKNKAPDILSHCEVQQNRTNPGDNLYGNINRTNEKNIEDKQIAGTLSFKATYTCTFTPSATGNGQASVTCDKVFASMGIFTKTPLAQQNWDSLVGGTMSIFKRFFPKVGADGALTEIQEIPAVTNASYQSPTDTVLAGDHGKGRSGDQAQVFIPYVGGIQEYFLNGIQTALRPKGMGNSGLAGQGKTDPAITNAINCNKNSPDPGNVAGLYTKERLINEFGREFPGNHIADCYNDLVNKAKSQGYDAAFVMAIWIEESGASDYKQFPNVSDFGCTSKAHNDFDAQISCFLQLKEAYKNQYPQCQIPGNTEMRNFLLVFSEGPNGGACNLSSPNYNKFTKNTVFPSRIDTFYQRVSGNSLPSSP